MPFLEFVSPRILVFGLVVSRRKNSRHSLVLGPYLVHEIYVGYLEQCLISEIVRNEKTALHKGKMLEQEESEFEN